MVLPEKDQEILEQMECTKCPSYVKFCLGMNEDNFYKKVCIPSDIR